MKQTAIHNMSKESRTTGETRGNAGRARKPQAERSAETQSKVISAAIACLHRYGYSATTVTMVADVAKVSRGAMTHQYPTKTDVMLAVVDAVFEDDSRCYRQAVEKKSPTQMLQDLPATMWDIMSRPSGTAVMEIMLASRSDEELADKLRTIQHSIDVRAHDWVIERLEAAGLQDHPDGESIHRVFVAAIRGLLLEALFKRDRTEIEKSVKVLGDMLTLLYPTVSAKTPARKKRA
ncbi:MAG: TetR/AcrR family transcriptional regulator [Paraburkholderia sp.]|jgi:AcrR family transcriptional regulator|uniref:TetR/AcrR family transcriptional regulator n=1 Tax=Burkholderiaceae TaxID=119060 RepID=UPI001BB29E47|nr:TetR/AcrR family transcriptional regulator [Burkholderia sp. 4M9327F10]